ncbi:hypothetical protein TthWC1_1565 [Thermoanaerobacter thermohydrosulfuricus WC1]|uniref:Uncharacterized protein n=1 Tax=Thermoanaerobacter thermohydrosulfuricus WC1 TaxID=1198630 RepID=M8CWZ2_THETY|nr:hypothetical protein [Thermoanaerobacter thermohydrosulfuricus]EMT38883.1 hypothetical protein TthWC1_1565 [Thermoanaerobacter thermohydrosulfuricus WC1]
MAETPFKDLDSVEILSGHISGLQHAVNKIEKILNMRTNIAQQHLLNPITDQEDPALRYRIYEGTIRNWLEDPEPVIYRDGAVVQPTEYKVYPAYGTVIFNEQQSPTSEIRADFSYIDAGSQTIREIYTALITFFWHPQGTWRGNGITAGGVDALIAANKADVLPFIVPEKTRYTGIGFYILTAAGSKGRAAIYTDNNGYPEDLILDCGEFDTSTAGFKALNIDLTLEPGIYWVARNTDGGVTFVGFRESSVIPLPFNPTGTYDGTPIAPVGGYRIDMTFGPFPDKFPAGAAYLRRTVYAGFFLRRE